MLTSPIARRYLELNAHLDGVHCSESGNCTAAVLGAMGELWAAMSPAERREITAMLDEGDPEDEPC
jgi:hypothetical protein